MRELIGRLDVAGNDVAAALRVIAHFDRLVEERTTGAALVRAAAALAACPAGFHDAARGSTVRFNAEGRALAEGSEHPWQRTPVPGQPGSSVWLERAGEEGPLDALIAERCARGLQSLTRDPVRSTAAAVRIACDAEAPESHRQAAVTRLGLNGRVTVAIALGKLPTTRRTRFGDYTLALLTGTAELPEDVRIGTAVAETTAELPAALDRARLAFLLTDRPTGPGACQVAYEDLGALASIANRFTSDEAATVPDVRHLDKVRANHAWIIDTLQAVLDQPSPRQAAAVLHIHHSTLQERLELLTPRLGYVPTTPAGRGRATAAVLLWRIAHNGPKH